MSPHHETHGVASKVRTSQLNKFYANIKHKDKGKIVRTKNKSKDLKKDKITMISPKTDIQKSMTLVKRIQKPKKVVTYV